MTIRIAIIESDLYHIYLNHKNKLNEIYNKIKNNDNENIFTIGICENYNKYKFIPKFLNYTEYFPNLTFGIHIFTENDYTHYIIKSNKILKTFYEKNNQCECMNLIMEMTPDDYYIENEITHLINPDYDCINNNLYI